MHKTIRSVALLAVALALVPAAPRPAPGDDAATRRRLQELEREQRRFGEELEKLRREVERPQPAPAAPDDRVGEVERRQSILAAEVERLRELLVLPETRELKPMYGLAPAASRVYGIKRGLSIGGYAEANYKHVTADADGAKNDFDFLRFVLYVGYKFNDWIVLNTETELEHATTNATVSASPGYVALEFATLDFLLHPAANARGGLILMPVGFINLVHEPPFYFGNVRPPVERIIIPSTWRETGFGLFGEVLPGLEYQMYGVTGFNAKGYRNTGIKDGRQNGNRSLASDWAFVGRLDYDPVPSLLVGGSLYLGNAGQDQQFGNDTIGFETVGAFTQLYEIHAQFESRGFHARALGAMNHIGDAGRLSRDAQISKATKDKPVAKDLLGAYVELAYDVLPWILPDTTQYLAPWFRYSWLDTQNAVPAGFTPDRTQRQQFYEFGLQYKPIPDVVLKVDYHIHERSQGDAPDELRIGGGLIF